jgi:asparagine synthase (glutamine-hydrolysing)
VGKLGRLPLGWRKAAAALVSRLPKFKGRSYLMRASQSVEQRFIGNAFIFTADEKRRIMAQPAAASAPQTVTRPFYDKAKGYDDITKMQYIDINLWLVGDILVVADRMAMAHSLELRVPYLDKDVFTVARSLPTPWRVSRTTTKWAMRQAARRHIPDVSADMKKLGFPVPIRVWLRQPQYYDKVRDAFSGAAARQYFNSAEIRRLLDDHFQGRLDNSRKIWTIYMFLVWYERYFGDADATANPLSAG